MPHELRGRTVAILAAAGVERIELDLPPRGALYGAAGCACMTGLPPPMGVGGEQ